MFEPFRFFAVDAGASFHLGVAYDHFIAGGDSIVALLKGIAARYDGPARGRRRAPDLYPPRYARLFARNALAFYVGQYLLPGMLLRARRAFRPRYPHGDGKYNAFTSFELRAGRCTRRVVRTAKAWGVTLNDLLLAMLLCALSPEVPERLHARGGAARSRSRRSSTSAARSRRRPQQAFGQFLSSFLVSHPVPAGVHARGARARRARADAAREAPQALPADAVPARLRRARVAVHDAGAAQADVREELSGVGRACRRSTSRRSGTDVPGRRARCCTTCARCSTGPFAPIVLAPASVGECLHIGVSYRTSAFTARGHRSNQRAPHDCARDLA